MKKTVKLIAICSVVFLSLSFIAANGIAVSGEEKARPRTSPRVVLVEYFGALWCPSCVYAEDALNRLANEYPLSQLAILEWHIQDQYAIPEGEDRASNFYGVGGIPAVFFDGVEPYVGASSSSSAYNVYKTRIDNHASTYTSLRITLDGYLGATTGWLNATVYAHLTPTETNLWINFVIYEDKNYTTVYAGRTYWLRYDAVAVLPAEQITITAGQTLPYRKTFSINPNWETDRLGAVVFVQTRDRTPSAVQYISYEAQVVQAAAINLSAQTMPIPEFTVFVVPLVSGVVLFALVSRPCFKNYCKKIARRRAF